VARVLNLLWLFGRTAAAAEKRHGKCAPGFRKHGIFSIFGNETELVQLRGMAGRRMLAREHQENLLTCGRMRTQ